MSYKLAFLVLGLLTYGVTSLAAPPRKTFQATNSFSMVSSMAKYYQYQLYEGKTPEQLSEITFTPAYQTSSFKASSIINYSHNEANPEESDLDDPLYTVSSLPKNISRGLKGRYFLTGAVGLSKNSREVKGQYGAVGGGYGLALDSANLRIPAFSLTSSLSLVKAFQKSELTIKDESNVNVYSVSNTIFGYTYKKLTTSAQFIFMNSLKYNDEYSNQYLTVQEVGYAFNKSLAAVFGHANKAKTMDEESGEFNIRVLNNETSYFYFRLDISI